MKEEDKQLLLEDLSARLPYGVKIMFACNGFRWDWEQTLEEIRKCDDGDYAINGWGIHGIKPYLRPLSSMTEKEKEDLLITLLGKDGSKYFRVLPDGSIDNNDAAHQSISNFNIHWINSDVINTSIYIEWLNKHHFDHHGLIEKGLAIKAPEGMYNIK